MTTQQKPIPVNPAPQILKPEQAAQAPVAPLPPPGHERNEELKRRTDNLQQYAESDKVPEAYSFDPSTFDVDRELRNMLERNILEVTSPSPGFKYGWFFVGTDKVPGEITFKQVDGWEVVQGDMPECKHLLKYGSPDTTRRFGDTLLMRIPEALYYRLELRQTLLTQRKLGAGDDALMNIVEEYKRKIHSGVAASVNDPKIFPQSKLDSVSIVAAATVDRMLRQGNVPGVAPGSEYQKI